MAIADVQADTAVTVPVPGPKGRPLIGSTLEFQREPLEFCLRTAAQYGEVSKFRVGIDDWYLINRPDYIYDITVRKASIFYKPKLARRLWKPFLGDGVLSLDGDAWKKEARLVKPGFHKKRIDAYGEVMVDYTMDMFDAWDVSKPIEMCQEMTELTLRIVAKTLFDSEVKHEAPTIGHAMETLQETMVEHINNPIPVPKWWPSKTNRRKLGAISAIEEIVWGFVESRRKEKVDHGDLLSMMVLAKDEEGNSLSDKQLRDETMTLIFAGHETTAISLAWMTYILAKFPEQSSKLRHELDSVLQGRPPRVEDLSKLPYLEMFVKESMRYLPSVWAFMREPQEDVRFGDHVIPKGAICFVSPYVIHHNDKVYDNPYEFRPERFSSENEKKIPKGGYIPFALGPRICLGKGFAMMESKLILACLAQRFEYELQDGYELDFLAQLSLRPRQGLPVHVRKR